MPQWNCRCLNCRTARKLRTFRSQSSAAVSDDGKNWLLLNASPDLSYQFASFPALSVRQKKLRGTAVAAVVLTDGEMDHVGGLLSLREEKNLRLICKQSVKRLLTSDFPLLPTFEKYCRIHYQTFPAQIAGIHISAFGLATEKAPRYSRHRAQRDEVVGLRLESIRHKRSCIYLPGLPAITPKLEAWLADCDCLIVDGTFWSEREMISLGLSRRTARDMGHVPIHGPHGSLEWLRRLTVRRKIYTHINNSNPILSKTSRERKLVEQAGVEVSYDGMEIHL